ncbi:Scn11a [Symbiodinium sp. CCMP2592]|nr:Scn11a [Symbiodinium sp. CCMP2592]
MRTGHGIGAPRLRRVFRQGLTCLLPPLWLLPLLLRQVRPLPLRAALKIMSGGQHTEPLNLTGSDQGSCKQRLAHLLDNWWFNVFILFVVLVDLTVIALDVTYRAQKIPAGEYLVPQRIVCLVVYSLELGVVFFARAHWPWDLTWWVVLLATALSWLDPVWRELDAHHFLLCISFLRITRLFKATVALAEKTPLLGGLRAICAEMSSCLGIWFWAWVVLSVVNTMLAVVLVELVYPALADRESSFWDCPGCLQHFSSVLEASLWLFTAVFSGGWEKEITLIIQATGGWTWPIFGGSFSILSFLVIKAVAEIFALVLSRGDHRALAKREVHEAPAEPVQTVESHTGTDLDADTKLLQLLLARFQQDDQGRARLDGLLKQFCQAGAGVAEHPRQVVAKEDALETTIGKSAEGERVQVL